MRGSHLAAGQFLKTKRAVMTTVLVEKIVILCNIFDPMKTGDRVWGCEHESTLVP